MKTLPSAPLSALGSIDSGFRVGYKPAYKNETYMANEIREDCCDGYREKNGFCVRKYYAVPMFGMIPAD